MNDTDTRTDDFLPSTHGRLTCSKCGMVANVDPEFHRERYDHRPTIRNGGIWTWNGWTFVRTPDAA